MPILNPRTGLPFDTNPDDVAPGDLQAMPVPQLAQDAALDLVAQGMPMGTGNFLRVGADMAKAGLEPPPAEPVPSEPPPAPLPPAPPPPPSPVQPALPPGRKPAGAGAPRPGGESGAEAAARKGEQSAQGKQLDVAEEEKQLGVRKAGAEADQAGVEQKAIDDHYKMVDQKVGEASGYLQKKQDEAANFKIKDLYEGQLGGSIAAALLEGLGAFAATLTGGPNHALNTIERGRQQFRQKQQDELEQKYKGVADAKDRVEFIRAELAAKEAGMYKSLAAARVKNMARFGADQARIEGDKIYTDLLGKQAEAERTWQSMLHNRGQQEKLQASEIARNYAGAAKDRAEAAAAGQKGKPADPALLEVTGPDGKAVFRARSPEEAKEAKERMTAVRDVMAKSKRLESLIAEGRAVPGGERSGQMAALQAKIVIAVNHAEKLGALDKGTQELVERMLPTGYGALGQGPARIKEFIDAVRDGASKNFDSYGVPGAKVMSYLERADADAGKAAPSRTEYAREMDRLRTMKPGSPEYDRQLRALNAARASMGQ